MASYASETFLSIGQVEYFWKKNVRLEGMQSFVMESGEGAEAARIISETMSGSLRGMVRKD